jgi:hypothetical protein
LRSVGAPFAWLASLRSLASFFDQPMRFRSVDEPMRSVDQPMRSTDESIDRSADTAHYLVSLCAVCLRQKRQNLLNSSRSLVFFLFLVVL